MKFRTRIILVYAVFALAASMALGISYNQYMIQRYESSARNQLEILSKQILNNLDGNIEKMSQVTLALLSNQEAVQKIRELSVKMEYPDMYETEISSAKAYIRRELYTAYNLDNFYRVIVFNNNGYIAASAFMQEKIVDTQKDITEIPWLGQVEGTKGLDVLIGLHPDDWAGEKSKQNVFSLVREIQGNNLGFIEVQQTEEYLKDIFAVPDETMKVIALQENGSVLYASEDINKEEYTQLFDDSNRTAEEKNSNNGKHEFLSVAKSDITGVKLILIQERKDAVLNAPNGWLTSAGVSALVFVPSLAFVILMAGRLTRPLQELRKKMERTQLSNLTDEIEIDSKDEDIRALTEAYGDLMLRLKQSLEVEKKLNLLQLQAQFDTLQAQINPHFMYNVLNVISSKGMENEDETICEICGKLADMLRYSTNVKTRYATIKEELIYAEEYFYLIKSRYGDRIKMDVDVEESICKEILPKTVLQQIVENCVNHGFENNTDQMQITLRGFQKDGYWFLSVQDNGSGFDSGVIENLKKKLEKTKKSIFEEKNNIELEIGGMGLVNTYARLLLIYSDSLVFELKNIANGSEVIFGAKKSAHD